MSMERLIKNGWFDDNTLDLPLLKDEIRRIKGREKVVIKKENKSFIVYVRNGADMNNLTQQDVYVNEVYDKK